MAQSYKNTGFKAGVNRVTVTELDDDGNERSDEKESVNLPTSAAAAAAGASSGATSRRPNVDDVDDAVDRDERKAGNDERKGGEPAKGKDSTNPPKNDFPMPDGHPFRDDLDFMQEILSYFEKNDTKYPLKNIANYAQLANYRDTVQCTWMRFKAEYQKYLETTLTNDDTKESIKELLFFPGNINWS